METNSKFSYGFTDTWPGPLWKIKIDTKVRVNFNKDHLTMLKTDNSQFMNKKAGDLQPGDHFWYENIEYRVIDHDDYEKMFGKKYKWHDKTTVLTCVNKEDIPYEKNFSHFRKTTTVSVKKTPVKLYSLEVGQDFIACGYKYTLINKGLYLGDYCYCIGLGDEFKGKRHRHLSGNFEVFPI